MNSRKKLTTIHSKKKVHDHPPCHSSLSSHRNLKITSSVNEEQESPERSCGRSERATQKNQAVPQQHTSTFLIIIITSSWYYVDDENPTTACFPSTSDKVIVSTRTAAFAGSGCTRRGAEGEEFFIETFLTLSLALHFTTFIRSVERHHQHQHQQGMRPRYYFLLRSKFVHEKKYAGCM